MKNIGVTHEQFQHLLIACADLPFLRQPRPPTNYMEDILTTVLDFHMQAPVVCNALDYFRENVQRQHGIDTHSQLQSALDRYPDTEEGNKEASRFLWNNSHWVRVDHLRRLLAFFLSINVTDQLTLHAWTRQAVFERDFKDRVKGLGIAVFHWLLIRSGVSTIKPDVWVINFVKRVTGKRMSEKVLISVFTEIAPLIGESLQTIDMTIWDFEKRAMATKDVPALRIACWHLLKSSFEKVLPDEAGLSEFNWQVVLDDSAMLRYDVAGLTMTPDRSLFGEAHQGTTTVALRQSLWNEGLYLEMLVCHETALSESLFEQLKERMGLPSSVEGETESDSESAWEATNDPAFEATFDVEYDLLMSPDLTIEELVERVGEILKLMVESMRELVK